MKLILIFSFDMNSSLILSTYPMYSYVHNDEVERIKSPNSFTSCIILLHLNSKFCTNYNTLFHPNLSLDGHSYCNCINTIGGQHEALDVARCLTAALIVSTSQQSTILSHTSLKAPITPLFRYIKSMVWMFCGQRSPLRIFSYPRYSLSPGIGVQSSGEAYD